jgi:hypothetical protein
MFFMGVLVGLVLPINTGMPCSPVGFDPVEWSICHRPVGGSQDESYRLLAGVPRARSNSEISNLTIDKDYKSWTTPVTYQAHNNSQLRQWTRYRPQQDHIV